jgi:hypothetical protein
MLCSHRPRHSPTDEGLSIRASLSLTSQPSTHSSPTYIDIVACISGERSTAKIVHRCTANDSTSYTAPVPERGCMGERRFVCSRGDDDRSDDHSLCWSLETETKRATKHIRQGRTPARREGGLVGAGRDDAWRRLVKQMTVLAEAVTVGKTS